MFGQRCDREEFLNDEFDWHLWRFNTNSVQLANDLSD